ncbi:alpha/beta hydrolase [Nocardia lijiangensis]|uniref:alpha/beta hydrolase n=1 Tax=Nocardia lijiangensis TaxID=299618 RepID=UPI000A0390B6|nr:alpha/beta hydrolase [Nocardia lijiangensis]
MGGVRGWCRAIGAMVLMVASTLVSVGTAEADQPALDWANCAVIDQIPGLERLQCATLDVPMDHAAPGGATVRIALFKAPARDPGQRRGSLVINRGGPGYPSSGYLAGLVSGALPSPWDDRVWDRYDVIAVDQRGIGFATPAVLCFDTPAAVASFGADATTVPMNPQDAAVRAARDAEFAAACRQRYGALLDHLTTAAVARDLDLVRAALGEPRLNFLGQSYGAALGLVYANLFPHQVGSFVLDSVLNPVWASTGPIDSVPSERTGSDVATTEAMNEALRLCAAGQSCAFAVDDPVRAFPVLLAELREHPIPLVAPDGGRTSLTYAKLVSYLGGALYQPWLWRESGPDRLLHLAYRVSTAPTDTEAAELARLVIEQIDAGGLDRGYSLLDGPYSAFTCNDDQLPRFAPAWWASAQRREAIAPGFATLRAYGTSMCAFWQSAPSDRYTGPWEVRTDTPALILNSRFDPATPLAGALDVARRLDGSRVLIHEGIGHIVTQQSSCGVRAVSDYLTAGTLPAEGATCDPDTIPFA